MADYISREETVKKIEEKLKVDGLMSLAEEVWTNNCLKIVLRAIMAVETADVQPMKRGYWIKQPEKFQIHEDVINSNYLYSCSCCNASDLHSERANNDGEVKFCWRCGARMDLKDGDTNERS